MFITNQRWRHVTATVWLAISDGHSTTTFVLLDVLRNLGRGSKLRDGALQPIPISLGHLVSQDFSKFLYIGDGFLNVAVFLIIKLSVVG